MHVHLYIWVYGCTHTCRDSFRQMVLYSCCSCTSWVCNCSVVKFLMTTQCPGGTLPNLPWHLGQWILCEVILLLMENASTGWGDAQVPRLPLPPAAAKPHPHGSHTGYTLPPILHHPPCTGSRSWWHVSVQLTRILWSTFSLFDKAIGVLCKYPPFTENSNSEDSWREGPQIPCLSSSHSQLTPPPRPPHPHVSVRVSCFRGGWMDHARCTQQYILESSLLKYVEICLTLLK